MSERYKEISAYIPLWREKPKVQVVEEIASYSLETKRIPDPYYFLIDSDGKLRSPQTGEPIEKSIEKISYLGQKEWLAVQMIEEWNVGRTEGVAFWISPPHPEKSQFTKIIISEIINEANTRNLFNRATMLNMNGQDCLDFARNFQENALFDSPEDLRGNPVFLTGRLSSDWLTFLEQTIQDPSWNIVRGGGDLIEKEKAIGKANSLYERILGGKIGYDDDLVREAIDDEIRMGTFGLFPVSCPPNTLSSFEAFYINSFKVDTKFVKNCGNCGRKIGKLINKGFRCVCGGVYEGC